MNIETKKRTQSTSTNTYDILIVTISTKQLWAHKFFFTIKIQNDTIKKHSHTCKSELDK